MLISSFKVGLLQGKVARLFKNLINESLMSFNVSQSEWTLLGILYDSNKQLNLQELAQIMGVEPPFTTALIDSLEEKKYVERKLDVMDKRSKCVQLTQKGKEFVEKVEKELDIQDHPLFEGIKDKKLEVYIEVMEKIAARDNLY